MSDGTPAVLKVLVPSSEGAIEGHEATVLRLASGDGCHGTRSGMRQAT